MLLYVGLLNVNAILFLRISPKSLLIFICNKRLSFDVHFQ